MNLCCGRHCACDYCPCCGRYMRPWHPYPYQPYPWYVKPYCPPPPPWWNPVYPTRPLFDVHSAVRQGRAAVGYVG